MGFLQSDFVVLAGTVGVDQRRDAEVEALGSELEFGFKAKAAGRAEIRAIWTAEHANGRFSEAIVKTPMQSASWHGIRSIARNGSDD